MTTATEGVHGDPSTVARREQYRRSRAERFEDGRSRRSEVPLEAHAEVPRSTERRDVLELLTAQDETRLPNLVPIRHGRMSATAFTFYRGAAAVMASDLSMKPTTDLQVQLCGDAHLSNFGVFNGPDRRLLFDINDFDETLPGPFEWDVKRLAASVTIAGRNNGLPPGKSRAATSAAVRGYRETIARASSLTPVELHYFRLEIAEFAANLGTKKKKESKRLDKVVSKAATKNSLRAFDKLTAIVDGERRIIEQVPVVTRLDDRLDEQMRIQLRAFFEEYRTSLPLYRQQLLDRYHYVDLAHKIVGVGSVGTRCLIVLLTSGDDEPLFLQFKETTTSVLEPYLGTSTFSQHGERVVQGQRVMQAAGDIFLGWSTFRGVEGDTHDFYFRQLWDGKGSATVETMGAGALSRYAYVCGGALALAHARSGDPATITGYLGDDESFDAALVEFADAYAVINAADHETHLAAISDGEIHAIRDI